MSDTTAAGLTEAERKALWGVDADIETFAVVERILGARLAAVQAERDAARAEVEALRERVGRVESLATQWNDTPDYTPSTYDQGRVDQRHDMTQQLLEVLEAGR